MGTLNARTTCFVALCPDDSFAATVFDYKQRTKRRAGPQLYLDDPPHLTLYLAAFADIADLKAVIASAVRGMLTPNAVVRGWHIFRNDPLNGNHTLVCDIDSANRQELANGQQRICEAIAHLRDAECATERYSAFWPNLSEDARANVVRWGFPFVGAIWRPHITVASIRPSDWDAVWSELENDSPSATVRFPELCLFALKDGQPELLERFHLETLA